MVLLIVLYQKKNSDMVLISLDVLKLFMDIVKNVPKRVPNRNIVIKARFKSQLEDIDSLSDQLNFHIDLQGKYILKRANM